MRIEARGWEKRRTSTRMPGSVSLYAPGKLTVESGVPEPLPPMRSWLQDG